MAMGLDPLEPTDLDHRLEVAEAVVRELGRAQDLVSGAQLRQRKGGWGHGKSRGTTPCAAETNTQLTTPTSATHS
jgi:hypothetical protein